MNQYLEFGVCLLLGQLFHLAIKGNALKKRAIAGNMSFHIYEDFIKKDSLEILGTFIAGIIVMVAYTELVGMYPKIEAISRILFILLGYSGSSLVLSALSKADKGIQSVIDKKTNLLDNIINTDKMDYEWAVSYQTDTDKVGTDYSTATSVDDFATNTGGVHNSTEKEIVWSTEPAFTSVDFVKVDGKTYIAGPIRRPVGV